MYCRIISFLTIKICMIHNLKENLHVIINKDTYFLAGKQ